MINGLLKIPRLCLALIGSSANERLWAVPRVPGVPAPHSVGAGGQGGVPARITLQTQGWVGCTLFS